MGRNVSNIFTNLLEIVPQVVHSMTTTFSFDCVYFLRSLSTNDVMSQTLARKAFLTLSKSLAFTNLSVYSSRWKEAIKEQCQVPLRVMLQYNETEMVDDFKDFNNLYIKHPDKIRPGAWIIFLKSFNDNFVKKFFRKIYLPLDIEFMVAWICGKTVHLKEVYQVSPLHPLKQPYFGNWSSKAGFFSPEIFSRHLRRSNLDNLELKVGYIDENLPFTIMQSSSPNTLGGYFGEIWHAIEGLMNISSTYIKIELKREKEEEKNSWLRVMKLLQSKKIDVGLGDFILSATRLDHLDFSHPLLLSDLQMFYQNPPSSRLFHGYLLPLKYDIWLALLFWSIIISLCISCFSHVRKRYLGKKKEILSTSTAFFMTFGGLCGQGSTSSVQFPSIRMLLLLTYIVAGVIIPSYSASLTQHLTYEPLGMALRSLSDVFETKSRKIIVVDGSYEYYILQDLTANDKMTGKTFLSNLKNKMLPKSYRDALILTCKDENVGFFTVTSTLVWEMNKMENAKLKDECRLRKMTDNAGTSVSGIIYPKNSRFRRLIDHQLKGIYRSLSQLQAFVMLLLSDCCVIYLRLRLWEIFFSLKNLQTTGLINRLQQKYWPNHSNLVKRKWKADNLENLSPVFHILAFGAASSLVIYALEKLIKNTLGQTQKNFGFLFLLNSHFYRFKKV